MIHFVLFKNRFELKSKYAPYSQIHLYTARNEADLVPVYLDITIETLNNN